MGSPEIIAWQRAVAALAPPITLLSLTWPAQVPRPVVFQLGAGSRTADLVYGRTGINTDTTVVLVREAGRLVAAMAPAISAGPPAALVNRTAHALTLPTDDKLCRDVYRYVRAMVEALTMTNISYATSKIADAAPTAGRDRVRADGRARRA